MKDPVYKFYQLPQQEVKSDGTKTNSVKLSVMPSETAIAIAEIEAKHQRKMAKYDALINAADKDPFKGKGIDSDSSRGPVRNSDKDSVMSSVSS